MKAVKSVGIKDLKNRLSAYIRDVSAGTHFLITDRGRVVAELHKPFINTRLTNNAGIDSEWIENGKLLPAKSEKKKCPKSPLKLKNGTSTRLLDEERSW